MKLLFLCTFDKTDGRRLQVSQNCTEMCSSDTFRLLTSREGHLNCYNKTTYWGVNRRVTRNDT